MQHTAQLKLRKSSLVVEVENVWLRLRCFKIWTLFNLGFITALPLMPPKGQTLQFSVPFVARIWSATHTDRITECRVISQMSVDTCSTHQHCTDRGSWMGQSQKQSWQNCCFLFSCWCWRIEVRHILMRWPASSKCEWDYKENKGCRHFDMHA